MEVTKIIKLQTEEQTEILQNMFITLGKHDLCDNRDYVHLSGYESTELVRELITTRLHAVPQYGSPGGLSLDEVGIVSTGLETLSYLSKIELSESGTVPEVNDIIYVPDTSISYGGFATVSVILGHSIVETYQIIGYLFIWTEIGPQQKTLRSEFRSREAGIHIL